MGTSAQLNSRSSRQPEILLVEDEQIVALDLQDRLTRLGYKVAEIAASGEEALRSMEERLPDLIVMDIVLAGRMSGTETAKIVRERFDVPVVYLTAYSDPATLEDIKETEGQGFLTKPFQPQDLDAVLQLALSRHGKEQHRRSVERTAWEEICERSKQELEQFTYAAGHDLQEPLRTTTFFIELLARGAATKLDKEERELLCQAQAGLSRMSTLLHDLVTYAQVGLSEGAPLPNTPADAILAGALANLRAAIADTDAKVVCNPLPVVRADPSQLLQVFQNLVGNAIKYRKLHRTPEIHVSAEKRPGEIVFSVKDNGIGFDPAQSKNIFAPFKRLHSQSAYPGTGIGLAICKKIVEAHGGKIWAEATPSLGATFSFTLPDPLIRR
jgi:two-component system, sensor histidine kinase and response regulator